MMSKKIKTNIDLDFSKVEEEQENTKNNKIIKRKQIEVKPMNEEEAILQMELLGHQFYMYKDRDTNKMTIVYKRKDENYGIIEAE